MMTESIYKIAIIGGGASGLMLAANVDTAGMPGIVLEGSPTLGSKLLMSGGGRCNITHGGSIKDFLSAYGDAGRALRTSLYKHSNIELLEWLSSHGMETVEEYCRVFPASMRARDVLDLLISEASSNLWQIETGCKVTGLDVDDDSYILEINGEHRIRACNVVIATGGITYPETGSDGSMFEALKDSGIGITDLRPALAPIYVEDYPYSDLSGISISNVTVSISNNKLARMTGDLLFTHNGFSGPAILNISKYAEPGCRLSISYNKELSKLPRRMQRILEDRARGESGDIRTKKLAALLARDDFVVRSVDPRGMVTSGGISLAEIDLKTMQIKSAPACSKGAVYAIGEAIDADGITGGYNLQLCWSTARTAASSLSICT